MAAKHFNYYDDWKNETLICPKCGWSGTFMQGSVEYYRELMDSSCPACDYPDVPMLAIVTYPTIEETEANFDRLSENEKDELARRKQFLSEFDSRCLKSPDELPDLSGSSPIILSWDFVEIETPESARTTVIRHGENVVWSEPALWEGYERFQKVVPILRKKYGERLVDVVPTSASEPYLYGDCLTASDLVTQARKAIHPDDIEEKVRSLDETCPLVPHTGVGRLFSTVRRMKAEKELGIPISRRTGFAISAATGKPANEMAESEWEDFYLALCGQLKRDYPEMYGRLFP